MVIGSSCTTDSAGFELIVIAPDLDHELLRLEVEPGDHFSLVYIHSVTGREVKGTFEITFEGRLLPLTTEYDSFGPGLPELDARQNFDIVNGIITFYHNEAPRDQLGLFVSPLTKERLFFFDQEYNLTSGQESALLVHIYIAP